MKRKIKRKKALRVFFLTLALCIMTAGVAAGMCGVYERTQKLRTGEARPAFSVMTSEDRICRVTVLGEERYFSPPEKTAPTPLEYSLIPPEVRAMWQLILYLFEDLEYAF